jgi:catechol 2,3-dioxygenase-like lactoylglutathione lyase family enzyme
MSACAAERAVRSALMATFVKSVTFDCRDALVAARFWAAALGSDVDEDATEERAYVEAPGWGGPNMWFSRVPEAKTAKNRIHFDLRAPAEIDAEVRRLVDLGATVAQRHEDHVVLQDPDGNEFCIE